MRGLPLTLMVHNDLTVIEKAEIEGVGDIGPSAAAGALSARRRERAAGRDVSGDRSSVAAVIKLRGYDDTYLYVARPLDPRVIEQLAGDAGERRRNSPISRRAASACRSPSR